MNTDPHPPGIIILGAGLHAKLVIEYLQLKGKTLVAILDDNPEKHGARIKDVPVTGSIDLLPDLIERKRVHGVALGFGNIRLRRKSAELFERVAELGVEMVSVMHPRSFISESAQVAAGLFMGPNAVLNTDTQVGENVIIYTGSTIDHDNVIGDHVFISPGVHTAGQVHIESGAYIGPGATICSGCRIGRGSIVGAGAVVLKDIPPGKLVMGAPARIIKSVDDWEQD